MMGVVADSGTLETVSLGEKIDKNYNLKVIYIYMLTRTRNVWYLAAQHNHQIADETDWVPNALSWAMDRLLTYLNWKYI